MRSSETRAAAAPWILVGRWSVALLAGLLLATASGAAGHPWSPEDRPSRSEAPIRKGLTFPEYKGTAIDPTGDTFDVDRFDIIGFSVDVVGGNLRINVTFDGAITPPDSDLPNAVHGFIDIDADQNGGTGDTPWVDFLTGAPISGLGNEFYVDLFTFEDGLVDVIDDPAEMTVGQALMSFTGDSFTIEVPLTLVGGDDEVNAAVAIIDSDFNLSDVAPNSGSVSSSDDTSILLQDNRFLVTIDWRRVPNFPDLRPARVSDFQTDDSAVFFFNNANNLEFLLKVLDGCDDNGHFWVFFAGATDVEFTVTVIDTVTGDQKSYFNPQGQPADAVTDNQAFATCP